MVNESFSKENDDKLRLIAKQYGNHISFHTITDAVTKVLTFGKDNMPGHVSIATYYRLFVAQILPEDVHKIIYLDGDMIVRGSLEKLWNTDLDGYSIAAVHDMDEQKHIDSHRLPYPMETGYFNAGMQLINVDYWRKNDGLSLFLNFLKEYADIVKEYESYLKIEDYCKYIRFNKNIVLALLRNMVLMLLSAKKNFIGIKSRVQYRLLSFVINKFYPQYERQKF